MRIGFTVKGIEILRYVHPVSADFNNTKSFIFMVLCHEVSTMLGKNCLIRLRYLFMFYSRILGFYMWLKPVVSKLESNHCKFARIVILILESSHCKLGVDIG